MNLLYSTFKFSIQEIHWNALRILRNVFTKLVLSSTLVHQAYCYCIRLHLFIIKLDVDIIILVVVVA